MFRHHLVVTVSALVLLVVGATAKAQTTVVASGLQNPTKIVIAPGGDLLVGEGGTPTPNTGRVSIVERSGATRVLISGLPSAPEPQGPPQGVTGLSIIGRTMFIALAAGDVTVAGSVPGQEVPNPMGPSSPILSSIVKVRFNRSVKNIATSFDLTLDDHDSIANGHRIVKSNQAGDTAVFSLAHDFRNLVRDAETNVRRANPFGIAIDFFRGSIWVANSSQNTIEEVNLFTGRTRRLIEFARIPNPAPFGPPMLEAVPTSVRLFGHSLLVSLESGFPFPAGGTSVQRVDIATATETPFITGLTNLLDVLPFRRAGSVQYLAVELSTDILASPPEPGRLLRYTSPNATPIVESDTLMAPSSVAYDRFTREAFLTEVFAGRVVKVDVN